MIPFWALIVLAGSAAVAVLLVGLVVAVAWPATLIPGSDPVRAGVLALVGVDDAS